MGESRQKSYLRVIEGRPWKQALICARHPAAPYEPWHQGDGRGEVAVVVLDTQPHTVLGAFHGNRAINTAALRHASLLRPVSEVEEAAGFSLDEGRVSQTGADALFAEITKFIASTPPDRAGDSSMVVGRIFLHAEGRCTVCYGEVVITTEEQLDQAVHTASEAEVLAGADWPALLCSECLTAMRGGGFTSVADFVFAGRPVCPVCSAPRARRIGYGMPSYDWMVNMPPWALSGGCVIDAFSPEWSCAECSYSWGHRD